MIPLKWLAILTGVLPLVTLLVSYLVAASYGLVSWCVPIWDGCTTISATGRHPPSSLIFKGAMIPSALVIFTFWFFSFFWLKQLGLGRVTTRTLMLIFGLASAVFLVLYTVALGHIGAEYRILRRIGVILFYAFTLIAQTMMISMLWPKRQLFTAPGSRYSISLVVASNVMLAVTGIINLVIQKVHPGLQWLENVVEWDFTIVLCLNFIWISRLWSVSKYSLTPQCILPK